MTAAAFAVCAWALLPVFAGAVDRRAGADVAKPALTGIPWSNGAKDGLGRDLDALLANAPTLRGAHVGLLVRDTRSGDVLYARNPDDAFVPASTLKLLTGSVALATLGPAFRFRTEAYLGPPNETLYIRAGGDPLLQSADLEALTRAAFATGAFHYPYAVAIDAAAVDFDPYPSGWSSDDFPYDYAAKLTPVPVDENAMQLTFLPGAKVGDPLKLQPDVGTAASRSRWPAESCATGDVTPAQPEATTGRSDSDSSLDVVRFPPRGCGEIVGSLALGAGPQTIGVAMLEPTAAVSAVVEGLAVREFPRPPIAPRSAEPSPAPADALYRSSPVPVGARLVWRHDGEPLSDVLADMWWPSDNFVAEMLLRAIGAQHSGTRGTTDRGADAERAWLTGIGIDPATLTIADGSGLSTYDRITPRALVAILQADWNGPYRNIVLDDLPIAGVRGTLEHSFAGSLAERRTFAKTGSVTHARGLAGYLATLHHGAVTFAWSIDDWMGQNDDLAALRALVLSRIIGD